MITKNEEVNNQYQISKDIQNLILYQRESLIKHIAKTKGWDEKELLKEFLFDKNNLIQTGINNDKKKSNQTYMDNNNSIDSDNDSINSIILSQFDEQKSTSLSNSSSSQSLDSQSNTIVKKKRGRPKKTTSSEQKKTTVVEKKKRGRPRKKPEVDKDKQKLDQPKRKRGRPKKNVEQKIIQDPNIDLEEKEPDDEKEIEVLKKLDTQLYEENSKQMKEAVENLFYQTSINSDSNIKLEINTQEDDSLYLESDDEESDIEYEEITCDKIEYKGTHYLLDKCNNNIYSLDENNTFVGRYDEKKMIIDFNAIE